MRSSLNARPLNAMLTVLVFNSVYVHHRKAPEVDYAFNVYDNGRCYRAAAVASYRRQCLYGTIALLQCRISTMSQRHVAHTRRMA